MFSRSKNSFSGSSLSSHGFLCSIEKSSRAIGREQWKQLFRPVSWTNANSKSFTNLFWAVPIGIPSWDLTFSGLGIGLDKGLHRRADLNRRSAVLETGRLRRRTPMHDLNFSPSPISSRDGVTSRRYAGERAPCGFGFGRRGALSRISWRRQSRRRIATLPPSSWRGGRLFRPRPNWCQREELNQRPAVMR